MKQWTLLLVIMICLSCKKSIQNKFLQQEDISLVQPRIEVKNTLIDSFINLNAKSNISGTEIYFTTDGSEPTTTSIEYDKPLIITESGTYKFKAFHPTWKSSETTAITFFKKGHHPKNIVWYSKQNEKYSGQGTLTLINQKKAALPFSNSEWVGFDSIVNAEVFFKEKTFIKSMDIGFLSDVQSWIFPPVSITIFPNGSNNIEDIVSVQLAELKEPSSAEMKNINIEINKEVNSLRFEIANVQSIPTWHEGSGNKAWLFMDEWIFN